MTHIRCHVSGVTCQVSCVSFFLDKVMELVGGGPTPSSLLVFGYVHNVATGYHNVLDYKYNIKQRW